jgi:hypothetical protein
MRQKGLVRLTMTVALLAVLSLFCVNDLVMAAMPDNQGATCVALLCDRQSGCGATTATTLGPPVATPPSTTQIAIPLGYVPALLTVEPPGPRGRGVAPLAPRSPPIV